LRSKSFQFVQGICGLKLSSLAMLGAGCLSLMVLAGCQTATVATPVDQKFHASDPDSQMDFWHSLADRPVTCNDDAFHALLLYADGKDDAKDYDARVTALKDKGLLPPSFSEPPNMAIERGVLAVAIVKLTGIKGGWVMHLFGATPRYAVRELEYDGIYPPSSPQQTFSGAEFVGIMGKLDDYQQPAASDTTNPAS
jgi:hypothetical protein